MTINAIEHNTVRGRAYAGEPATAFISFLYPVRPAWRGFRGPRREGSMKRVTKT